jgi:hypothetical protein
MVTGQLSPVRALTRGGKCGRGMHPSGALFLWWPAPAAKGGLKEVMLATTSETVKGVEVILRHFHRYRYKSSPLWFFVGEGLAHIRCKL